jgi:mono/diheme cytochrome c family protein
MRAGRSTLTLATLTLALLVALPVRVIAQPATPPQAWPHVAADPLVTPVTGPSWLTRLGVALDKTSLGRGTGTYGPATAGKPPAPASLAVRPSSPLTGEDIYRLNCLACHGLQGRGAPPEVKSAVDPVIGASLDALRRAKVRQDVLARVHRGGQRMPSREYLRDPDLARLYEYLNQLAGTPAASHAKPEQVTWARLGEQVVKGTCHICHDATGAWPTEQARIQGAIPSLEALMATRTVADFVTKAGKGAPVGLSSLTIAHRGRMPVFTNLEDEEIAAAYVYLATYPPRR